jgi:hypothetical protein
MGHQKELENWILDNSHLLNLKIEQMSWTQDWFPEYSDFRITFLDKDLEGRGVGKNRGTAFLKAFSELVERSVCSYHKINSNGVAAHYDRSKAIDNARKELIERDAILCHHLTRTPFLQSSSIAKFDYFKKCLSIQGMELSLGEAISSVEGYRIAVCCISGNESFGTFWGYGCDTDVEKAFEHAILESMINVSAYLYGCYKKEEITYDDFVKILNPRGIDHQRFYFSKKKSNFEVVSDLITPESKVNINELVVTELTVSDTIFFSSPMYVVQAKAPLLQGIFYGTPGQRDINIKRLRRFTGKEITFQELSIVPHPIG